MVENDETIILKFKFRPRYWEWVRCLWKIKQEIAAIKREIEWRSAESPAYDSRIFMACTGKFAARDFFSTYQLLRCYKCSLWGKYLFQSWYAMVHEVFTTHSECITKIDTRRTFKDELPGRLESGVEITPNITPVTSPSEVQAGFQCSHEFCKI